MSDSVNLTIDGVPVTVPKGTTVYQASRKLGIDVPIFCYQDRMPPFGACRVCLVEVEKMPKLQTSCTLEATEGMVVKTQSQTAQKGREGIWELLLINHPLDCPICDRGGECPLQEQALHHGPGESRFYEEKRHFKKPYSLGPVLMLDRERCIVCARCTRFGDLVAGDNALEFIDRGYRTEVGTPGGGPAESKFIGNTIMICPVGALTSQVYRFRARPWDNQPTPSTCTLCPVGCSMILDSRDGEIMRTRSREDKDVNDIWMCDKGWFGYEFTSDKSRLTKPLIKKNGTFEEVSWNDALSFVASKMQSTKVGAVGGNPLTVEENYLFQKLIRQASKANNVDHRVGSIIPIEQEGLPAGMELSIGECENLEFAYLIGLDITEEFPVLWLRLRYSINKGAEVVFVGNYAPEVAPHLSRVHLHAPDEALSALQKEIPHLKELIQSGKKGAIFVGRQYLAHPQRSTLIEELKKLGNISINILEGQGNSVGARFAGMHPELGPQGERLSNPGLNTYQMLEEMGRNGWDLLYIAGADLANKVPANLWNAAKAKLKCLVVQDLFLTKTAMQADVVLPTLSYVEKGGHFINIEGRVQTLLPGKDIPEELYSDGEIFTQIGAKLNMPLSLDPFFLDKLQPHTRIAIKKFPASGSLPSSQAGKLQAVFAPSLFDHGVRMQKNTHLIKMSKDPKARMHPNDGPKWNVKNGDEIKVFANGNEIKIKLKLDSRVALGTIVLPLGFPEIPVHDLSPNLLNGLPVEIST